MKRLRGKLTYANVTATVAVFLVLAGGTAFAAKQALLPKNSVGSNQLKPRSVTATKLSGSATGALKGAPGPQGPVGPAGPEGAKGATGPEGALTPLAIDASASRQALWSGTWSFPLHLDGQTTSSGLKGAGAFLLTELAVKAATPFGEPNEICAAHIRIYDNGEYLTSLSAGANYGAPGNPATLSLYRFRAAPFAFGLTDPGASHAITAEYVGTENECAPGSELIGLRIVAQPLG
jgi:hypothetical protein